MLDIIIPVYKAKNTLLRLLMNIAIQKNVSDFKVYLVIDADLEDYSYEVDFVKKYYPINVLYLDKNVGPGMARQYGIDHSDSPYIMFIDADDYLYNPYSLSKILFQINNTDFDFLITDFRYERDNEIIIKRNDSTWLHGKVYKRNFLVNNNIRFNNTRSNEDNGFNCFVLFSNPKVYKLNTVTYVYSENNDSITRKNNRKYKFTGLEYFTYNVNWAVKMAIKYSKNVNCYLISKILYMTLLSMYYYYLDLYNEYDVDKIIIWSKNTLDLYMKYEKYITEIDKEECMKQKKNENKSIDCFISFSDFIEKVGDYNG